MKNFKWVYRYSYLGLLLVMALSWCGYCAYIISDIKTALHSVEYVDMTLSSFPSAFEIFERSVYYKELLNKGLIVSGVIFGVIVLLVLFQVFSVKFAKYRVVAKEKKRERQEKRSLQAMQMQEQRHQNVASIPSMPPRQPEIPPVPQSMSPSQTPSSSIQPPYVPQQPIKAPGVQQLSSFNCFCPYCGIKLESESLFCSGCGKKLD